MRIFTLGVALAMASTAAVAHDFKTGSIKVDHPYTPATVAQNAAGYMSITNAGAEPDRLLAVETSFPQVTLHESIVTDGVASMVEFENGVVIEPGATVAFGPGGKHVMFMGVGDPLEDGDVIAATLVFEKAGKIDVEFYVEAAGDTSAQMGHQMPFALRFAATDGDSPVDCASVMSGFGPKGDASVGLNDLRFYVSDVVFYDAAGTAMPAMLADSEFQLNHAAGSVALVDLTSTSEGSCVPGTIGFGEGTPRVNATVTGTQGHHQAAEVSFRVGVPQPLMQAVIAASTAEDAPSPLAELYWNWASGYRHFVLNHSVDMADGTYGEGYLHIGSRGCGPAEGKALSDRARCDFVNTAEVRLPVTGAETAIGVDIRAIMKGLPFVAPVYDTKTYQVIGEQPGTSCHGNPKQADCGQLLPSFGIDLETGAASAEANTVFRALK